MNLLLKKEKLLAFDNYILYFKLIERNLFFNPFFLSPQRHRERKESVLDDFC